MKTVSEAVTTLTIDIPQIVILPTREVNYGFSDFELQHLEQINYQPVSQEILLQHLEGEQQRVTIHFSEEQAQEIRLEDYIVRKWRMRLYAQRIGPRNGGVFTPMNMRNKLVVNPGATCLSHTTRYWLTRHWMA